MKLFTLLILALFFLTSTLKSQNLGDQAPDFVLQQLQGGNFTLSQQTEKVVFIFWLGNACPFCKSAAPSVTAQIMNSFQDRSDFVAIGVDTWDGSSSAVNSFKSQTGLNVNYLLKGSSAALKWSTTYDRLAVVDKSGKIVFKGTQGASSDISGAKAAIETAFKVVTSISAVKEDANYLVAYPNPFDTQTTISFRLEKPSFVDLNVFDISGKKVRNLIRQNYPSGESTILFSNGEMGNGIYFLRLNTENQIITQKIIVR